MGLFNNTYLGPLKKSVDFPQDGTPLFFGSIKRKSAAEGTPTSPPAVGGGSRAARALPGLGLQLAAPPTAQ